MGPKFQSYGKDLPRDLLAKVMAQGYEADMHIPVSRAPFRSHLSN